MSGSSLSDSPLKGQRGRSSKNRKFKSLRERDLTIMKFMRAHPQGVTQAELQAHLEVSVSSARTYLAAGVRNGVFSLDARRRPYLYRLAN